MVIGRGSPRLVISPSLWTDNNRDCPLSGKPGRASKKWFFMTRNVNVLWRVIGMAAAIALVGFVAASCDNGVSVAVYHTVSFDTGVGGSQVQPARVRTGQTVARPVANPTRAGYNFVNWYASATGGNPFNFAVPITADVTVFARWTAVTVGGDCEYADCECATCTGATCGCETQATYCGYGDCECAECTGVNCECETAACCECPCGNACDCAEEGACGPGCLCYVPSGNFVRVRGGSFQMGYCPSGQSVTPIRTVTVSGFYMGVFPVTQGEWYDVMMGERPSWFTGELDWNNGPVTGVDWRNLPVERVSWFDAVKFANALSAQAGLDPAYTINGTTVTWNRYANGYRLPTEAEWEFAARGGIVCQENFVFSGSDTAAEVAWYWGNGAPRTHEVGSLMPNALGLYDMSGNVWEWVWDLWGTYPDEDETNPTGPEPGAVSGGLRVFRGGHWNAPSENARSAIRSGLHPDGRYFHHGFRVVRP